MIGIKIKYDAKGAEHLFRVLPENLQRSIGDAAYAYARLCELELKESLLDTPGRPITPARFSAAGKILAKKLSRFRSVVKMPRSLVALDSMNPHFVALKPGRNITKWAKKHFTGHKVSGLSRVYRLPSGGFSRAQGRKSNLYVMPIPFTNRALRKARRRLPSELKEGVRKGFRKSRRR